MQDYYFYQGRENVGHSFKKRHILKGDIWSQCYWFIYKMYGGGGDICIVCVFALGVAVY